MCTSWPQACMRPFAAAKGASVSSLIGKASSSARTATASPDGPTRAMSPAPATGSMLSVPRPSATRPAVARSSWLGSGLACRRSRSAVARGSSSSREPRSARRRSVGTKVPLAGLFGARAFEEGDLGPLHAQVAVQHILREPGADDPVGFEGPERLLERSWQGTHAQTLQFPPFELGGIAGHKVRLGEAFPYTAQPGKDQDGEGQVRAGGRVGGAELQVELAGWVAARETHERRDTDGRLPVSLRHVAEARAPVMGPEVQVGGDARGGYGAERRQVLQDARGEPGAGLTEGAGPAGVVEDGGIVGVDQAHVHVDAVADTPGVRHRREASPVAEPAGHLADHLPEGGGPVGGREAIRRVARDLELPETIFREEDLRLQAGLPQRGHRQRAEGLDEPLGLVREARPRAEVWAPQQELLLE